MQIFIFTKHFCATTLDDSDILNTIIVPVQQRQDASGCLVSHRNQANLQRRPHWLCAIFATARHRLFVAFQWSDPTQSHTAWAAWRTAQRQLNSDNVQHSGGTAHHAEPGLYRVVAANFAWPTVAEAPATIATKRHATHRATARRMYGLIAPVPGYAAGRTVGLTFLDARKAKKVSPLCPPCVRITASGRPSVAQRTAKRAVQRQRLLPAFRFSARFGPVISR